MTIERRTGLLTTVRLLFLITILPVVINAQPQEATLLYQWTNDSITPTAWLDSRYNEIWGVEMNDKEFAIIGSTEGVHFFDLSDPANIVELKDAFVPGRASGFNLVHRDYHDYDGYLYAVADEGASTLQIIDMRGLPDSTSLVYDDFQLITTAHNIFIDSTSALLYACGARSIFGSRKPLIVLSLADPANPELVAEYTNIGAQSLPLIHDIYVRNDTAFLNGGPGGLIVADFSNPAEPALLGTLQDYPDAGYNHSGWVSDDGRYYFMADETHGMDLKVVDIQDLSDMRVITLFDAEAQASSSIPHNLLVNCNRLYVSYYYDGLQVYDISDPVAPVRIAYYDTYPGPDDDFFAGAWGVYPFPGSELVIVSDMQGGLLVFDDIAGDDCEIITSIDPVPVDLGEMKINPNPGHGPFEVTFPAEVSGQDITLHVYTSAGKLVWADEIEGAYRKSVIDLSFLHNGIYLLQCTTENLHITERFILTK